MDVVYHRNCLDGAYSSYILALLAKIITQPELNAFVYAIKQSGQHNLTTHYPPIPAPLQARLIVKNQDFFVSNTGLPFCTHSFYAGEFSPLKFSGANKILFVVDTHLQSSQNLKATAKGYEMVILIDHHTSFKEHEETVSQIPNLYYVFSEQRCASELVFAFVSKYFPLESYFGEYCRELELILSYVGKNDTKMHEDKESKMFSLGFYYFEIELSHFNPALYKRLGLLQLDYVLQKGNNAYPHHINHLILEISRAAECQILQGQLKGRQCIIVDPIDPRKISDIGSILAFLSARRGMANLSVLVMKKHGEVRGSTRSHHSFEDPLALKVARRFEGGGHEKAAGFHTSDKQFKIYFQRKAGKLSLNLKFEQIEQILFSS